MEPARAAQALASASASLTRPHDVAGALAALMQNCGEGLTVDATGIVVHAGDRLELLAASSHETSELEVHQLHVDQGPCVDAFVAGASTQESTRDRLVERWPDFGPSMLAAGFESVHAAPLVWHGTPIGAMGVFRRSSEAFTPEEDVVARAFADIATMLVVHLDEVYPEEVSRRIKDALDARVLLEQAKGVLADADGLSMAEAYETLVRVARDRRMGLVEWASTVVQQAQRR